MDEWPSKKKQRVIEIIKDLQLPANGDALDFGCGNGVLTEVVSKALPGWNVYGADISRTAIENAKMRYSGCRFFQLEGKDFKDKKFDFIFTNHVLEHVYNLQDIFGQLIEFLKPDSYMLHLLPCGNEGSLEHRVCLLNKEGINRKMGNRFFFEDHGHLRRLTGAQLKELAEEKGFFLEKEYYGNHFYGAIEYITGSNLKFIFLFTDARSAKNLASKIKLFFLRAVLSLIFIMRRSGKGFRAFLLKKEERSHDMLYILISPYYLFTLIVDNYIKRKSDDEWNNRKNDPKGSEMALFFKRES